MGLFRSPTHAFKVTGALDEEERHDARSDIDLGITWLTCATAGSTSDYIMIFFPPTFPLLSVARPKSRGS
jgi:hypothetical protein